MITALKDSNKHDYEILFQDATTLLREQGVLAEDEAITTLEEYFCNLRTIIEIPNVSDRYSLLPLDEEPLVINADKRTITIPANFKQNGISVQGDENAEMLFFTIDRFFDAIDFDSCEIYVQWESIDKIPYVTPISKKDLTAYPGKILFAWPLSSNVTKAPGTIKFAVRFIKRADASNKVAYSWSSLTATANINASLNYNFEVGEMPKVDDPDALFKESITNSAMASADPAAIPVFILDLPGTDAETVKVYLGEPDADGVRTKLLKVSAASSDTGVIRYEWYRMRSGELGQKVGIGVDSYEPTTDSTPSAIKTYYKKESETSYSIYDVTNGFDPDVVAYERYNTLTVSGDEVVSVDDEKSITGLYYAKAINRYGKKESYDHSRKVEFPTATAPVITEEGVLQPGIIGTANGTLTIGYASDEDGNTSFAWMKSLSAEGEFTVEEAAEATSNSYAPSTPGYYKVIVTSEVNLDAMSTESNTVRITNAPVAPVFSEADAAGAADTMININVQESILPTFSTVPTADLETDAITYQWFNDASGDGILDEDLAITDPSDSALLMLDDSYTGWSVRCVATNELNGATATSMSKLYIIYQGAVTEAAE